MKSSLRHLQLNKELFKVSVPALLYFCQNSLFYVSLTNLSSPVFQVLYQLKLLTTALVSIMLLKRKYTATQWISLCSLTIGAAIAISAKSGDAKEVEKSNSFVGIVAVFVACFCSAFAGVSFEKLLKKEPKTEIGRDKVDEVPSLWMRNVQLGSFSVLFASLQVLTTPGNGDEEPKPFLFGFTVLVWVLVLLRASAGLLVAIIIKNMDNVIKSIASSVSVLAGCIMSQFLFGTILQGSFWLGAVVVVGSSYIFSQPSIDLVSRFTYSRIEPESDAPKKRFSLKWMAIALILAVSGLLGTFFLLPEDLDFFTSPGEVQSRLMPVPSNYADSLHFLVAVVQGYDPKGDCGGCNVLWELHFTLKRLGYSTGTGAEGIPPDRKVVVIYPEINPNTFPIGNIHVRWLLAAVGVHVPESMTLNWNTDDLVFNYATSTGKNIPVSNVLQVVNTPASGDETDISKELFYSKDRSGIAWMMRKGQKFHSNIVPIHERPGYNVTQLDGIATISGLRKYEYFVTYDPYTYWTWFAAMQGTVSIVYPLNNVTKEEWALGTFLGSFMEDQKLTRIPGVAYGWEESEIEYARSTMHEVRPFLVALRDWGANVTVPRFARDCYRYMQGEREVFESALILDKVYPRPSPLPTPN